MSVFDTSLIPWDSLPNVEQTAYEWDSLGEPRHYSPISDANSLYRALKKSRVDTSWKESVQRFTWYSLPRITALQEGLYRLENGLPDAFEPSEGFEFMLNERGRMRPICGQIIDDRVVSHALNDEVLLPAIVPYLIYDNTASIKNRGIDMARRRLRAHLTAYYHREGTNEGYIWLKDQSKYYDNIRHDMVNEIIMRFTDDPLALKLVSLMLKQSRLDVSYMTDEEYAKSLETKMDRVAYRAENHEKKGEKFLEKGMNVGDQFSQTAGIVYPYRVDSYAKNVLGSKYYARYMDDTSDIDRILERLRCRAEAINRESEKLGMYTNERKTCFVKIDRWFPFLQHKVRLNKDGTVSERLKPEALTRIRRRLRKLSVKVANGEKNWKTIMNMYKSWSTARCEFMSYQQIHGLENLILKYYGRNAYEYIRDRSGRWKATQWAYDEWDNVCQPG